ncbi:coiled-coil domain-containing protein 86 [Copidosoma floridanum]|uniref:coiled-coil domain-containing protein 86 n=1 Tax=Copidosoma floridanum TaxID=29053 RepID=UPI0006C980EC|nr:coiled-coil domain-containing protein 86 [Copidosoma floridanum]
MVETQEKTINAEDLLAVCTASQNMISGSDLNKKSTSADDIKNKTHGKPKPSKVIPRGKPKSGRVWKEPKQRFKSIIKTKGLQLSLEKKQKLREDLKRAKELSREIKAQKEAEKQAKKERRKQNLKRQEENQKKSEIVQVIKNPAKIKRMKKKQLRMIEKRDTIKT